MPSSKLLALCLPLVLLAGLGCSSDSTADLADAAPASDAAAVPAHVVYLAFDGVTITPGTTTDFPHTNVSRALGVPSFTPPPFYADLATRDERLALIVEGARTILAPYNIEVVTERPAAAGYDMIVFGGNSEDAGFKAGNYTIRPSPCGENTPSISFIFELGEPLAKRYASDVVIAIGSINKIPYTDLKGDCMCGTSDDCILNDALCTMGGPGTPVDTQWWTCQTITTVDVGARFLAEFGAAQ